MNAMHKRLLAVLILLILVSALGALDIQLDYRFDNGYFSDHPERRIPLEYAASLWEEVITSEAFIPGGTSINLRSDYTEPGRTEVVINRNTYAFTIFIYAFDFAEEVTEDGNPDPSTSKAFGGGWAMSSDYGYMALNSNAPRPWFFDQTPETEYDVPVKDHYDLITSACHEMGHILGFLRGNQEPYVFLYNEGDERFDGSAVRRINNGQPVHLDFDSSHIREDWWNSDYLPLPPIDRHVMHTNDPVQGYRQIMTAVDLAIMEDMGWEVDYEALPEYPYTPNYDSRKDDLAGNFGIETGEIHPVGLWAFDNQESIEDAILGNPLRYSPPLGEAEGLPDLFVDDHIEVPAGGWLYCVPELTAPTGDRVETYSLIFDIQIDSYDQFYSLYNTHPQCWNDGAGFINPQGLWGAGSYGSRRVPTDRWVRLGVVLNGEEGRRSYYIDGEYDHSVSDITEEGFYSLFEQGTRYPFFCLFGDNDGEDNLISVKHVALYDAALSSAQMADLGTADQLDFGLSSSLNLPEPSTAPSQKTVPDAACCWGKKIYLFRNGSYLRFDAGENEADLFYPRVVTDANWEGLSFDAIDAAVNWDNGKVYFFRGNDYIRFDWDDDSADSGYPKNVDEDTWPGLHFNIIDAAMQDGNGKAYFFSGAEYIRYDMDADRADDGYPRLIEDGPWSILGFDRIDSAVNVDDDYIDFFRDDQWNRYLLDEEELLFDAPQSIEDYGEGLPF